MPRATLIAALVISVLVPVVLGTGLIRASSATYDEPVHLAAGYKDIVEGRYQLNALDHPPLAEMWAALPLLALRPDTFTSYPYRLESAAYHFGDLFLHGNRVPARRLLNVARFWNLLTLTLLLGPTLVLWARRLEGDAGAMGAAVAFAFCTPWLANAALVTTDAMSAGLFFVSFSLLAMPDPRSNMRWVCAGVAAGGALAAKFNMVLLPPLMLAVLLTEARIEKRHVDWKRFILAALAALVVLTLVYRVVHLPLWFEGLSATLGRISEGRPSFLMGRHGADGWWWYFPLALLVKTPLPLLFLGMGGAWCALRLAPTQAAWLLVPPIGYFLISLSSKTQIGYRHILPIYPFLCLYAGLAMARLWRSRSGRLGLIVICPWLAVSVMRVHPYYLAYFNELAGGPERGGEWLTDSNLDWGQDLPALARELSARGGGPVLLSYFGSADPSAYGISYVPLGMQSNVKRTGNSALKPGAPVLLAVSATNKSGVYFVRKDAFAWLAARIPVARPGWSIYLYDLTGDHEARERLARQLDSAGRTGDARTLRLK